MARPTPSPPASEEAVVSAVLGNDDLLQLILLRLGFPTSLVCAALVCRRWYRAASHPDFLRHFRRLHQPCVPGFYGDLVLSSHPRFVPLAEAPELATAVRRASALDARFIIRDCRNGRLLVRPQDEPRTREPRVLRPLQQTRGVAVLPPVPPSGPDRFRAWFFEEEYVREEDGAVVVEVLHLHNTGFVAKVSTFQSGIWTVRTAQVVHLHFPDPEVIHSVKNVLPPVRGKTYMKVNSLSILELDFVAVSFSVIQLPDAVDTQNYQLACGEGSGGGLFLAHAHGPLLNIWHKAIGNGGWVLVEDAIPVREAYNLHDDVTVLLVESNLEYVFLGLKTTGILVSMHLKSRAAKVHGEVRFPILCIENRVVPFRMTWPPIFPALWEGNIQ